MPWYPLKTDSNTWIRNSHLGKVGYILVNIKERKIDVNKVYPTKRIAYSECKKRNNPNQLSFLKEESNENHQEANLSENSSSASL